MSQSRKSSLPKVALKPLARENLEKYLSWRNDFRIYKWCRQCEPIPLNKHEAWFEWQAKDPSTRMYEIISPDSPDKPLGVCGLTSIDWINRRAEFSLYVGPEHHGNGYGSAGLKQLLSVGFKVFNLNCIWGEAFDGNPATETFKRLGFHLEGMRRQFYYRDGKYIGASLWSILRNELA